MGSATKLIRSSHIVSSAVRDILEAEPLERAGGAGMTPRQFQLLEFIALAGHHIDAVAKFLKVSPPAATKAVDKLEKRGLVVRSGWAGDRRVTMLACSDAGLRLVESYRALQQQIVREATGGLDDAEIARVLERYAIALIGVESRSDGPCLRCAGYYDRDCPLQYTQRGCAYAGRRDEA